MKIGMPTLVEFEDLEQNISFCKSLGLDFIELNMNLPIFTPEKLRSNDIAEISQQYGIEFSIHLPEELDLTSFQPPVRKGHLDRCKEVLFWANEAGIKILNMHFNNGIYFTLPDCKVWINEKFETEFTELLVDSYEELNKLANSLGVLLCIENTGNFHIPFVQRSLDRLNLYDNVFLTWDVGHDAKANFVEEPFFNKRIDRIRHMHLHDYNGKSDHQSLYSGIVPINSRLTFAREHNVSVVIEVKTRKALEESIIQIRERFQ